MKIRSKDNLHANFQYQPSLKSKNKNKSLRGSKILLYFFKVNKTGLTCMKCPARPTRKLSFRTCTASVEARGSLQRGRVGRHVSGSREVFSSEGTRVVTGGRVVSSSEGTQVVRVAGGEVDNGGRVTSTRTNPTVRVMIQESLKL